MSLNSVIDDNSFSSTKPQIIPESKLTKIISDSNASTIVSNLNKIKDGTNASFKSFDEYFKELDIKGQKCIRNYVKENQNQIYTTDGVISASKAARAGQIAHNLTIKQSTFAYKAATIGLKAFAMAGNILAISLITNGISHLVKSINEYINRNEIAIEKSTELTNSYKDQLSSLDSQIKKYQELNDTIKKGNLSTEEASSTKEQLLEIQTSLSQTYGVEASNLDLVNGKYEKQIDILQNLSKQKSQQYLSENYANVELEKDYLEKKDSVKISPMNGLKLSEDLIKYLQDNYSDLLIREMGNLNGETFFMGRTEIKLDKMSVEDAYNSLQNLWNDINYKFGDGEDAKILKDAISKTLLEDFDKSKIESAKNNILEYSKAQVISDDTLRPLYTESINVIEKYNNALSTGEGIESAKTNLDSLKDKIIESTGKFEDAKYAFDDIFKSINSDAEIEYNISKSFESDEIIKSYAEQLKTLNSFDLQAINFEDDIENPGERAFGMLISLLGLSEDKVQILIDKLVELGYVQGETVNTSPNKVTSIISWTDSQNEQLDKYQGEIQNIQKSIGSLTDGSLSPNSFEALDLIQSLGLNSDVATSSVNGLSNELKKAAKIRLDNVTTVLNEMKTGGTIDLEQYNSLINLFSDATDSIINFSESETTTKAFDNLNTITITDAVEELNTLQDSFSSLTSAYTTFKDKDSDITISDLGSLQEKFGNLDQYEDFVSTITKVGVSTKEVQTAFDNLASEYIYQSGVLDGLTESKKDLYIQSLKDIGVANAEEVVLSALSNEYGTLAEAKDYCVKIGKDLTEITGIEISELQTVYGLSNEAAKGIATYAIQKQYSNSIKLDTQAEIDNLIALAQYAGVAADSLIFYNNLKNSNSIYSNVGVIDDAIDAAKNSVLDKIKDKIIKVQTGISYEPKINKIKNSKTDSSPKDFAEKINWATNSIENLNSEIAKLNNELEKTNPYKRQIELLDSLIKKEQQLANLKKRTSNSYKTEYQNSIKGLDKKYIEAIKSDSKVNIQSFKGDVNEKLYKRITEAQDAWRQYQTSLSEYQQQVLIVAEKQKKRFETLQQSYEDRISRRENSRQDVQNSIDLKKARGTEVKSSDYNKLFTYNTNDLKDYNEQLKLAIEYRNKIKKISGVNSSAYKDADDVVQELQNSIKEVQESQIELNREILKLPIDKYEKAKDVLEEQLDVVEKQKSKVETAIAASSNLVQKQIDYYDDLKEATEKSYDAQIKAIQAEKDALTQANDEKERQIALEQAQYELERARNQKTSRIYREGEGFVYEAGQRAIYEAQIKLNKEKFNIKIASYDKEIDAIERAKESAVNAIDNQVNSLQSYKDMIDGIESKFKESLDLTILISQYGADIVDKIKSGSFDVIDLFRVDYNELSEQENALTEKIESYDAAINKIESIADKWNGNAGTIKQAQKDIENVLSNTTKEFKSIDSRNKKAKEISTTYDKVEQDLKESLNLITEGHVLAKDNEAEVLNERLTNLKAFAEQAKGYLSEITNVISRAEEMQSKANNSSNSSFVVTPINKIGKKHDGLESGYVSKGLSGKEEKDALSTLSLKKIEPDETLKLLRVGEAVLTEEQQHRLVQNMQNIQSSAMMHPINVNTSNIPIYRKPEVRQDVNLTIQNVNMSNVNNGNDFIKSLKRQMPSAFLQELRKN